jgi:DNA polymerase-1
MIRMPDALREVRLDSVRMLLQVHDELVFEAKLADVKEALRTIAHVMEGAAEPAVRLAVPVHVDAKAADNWEAAH